VSVRPTSQALIEAAESKSKRPDPLRLMIGEAYFSRALEPVAGSIKAAGGK
jgi:hypothetical protein